MNEIQMMTGNQPFGTLVLVTDLFFKAKIKAVADASGANVTFVRSPANAARQLCEGGFRRLIIDL